LEDEAVGPTGTVASGATGAGGAAPVDVAAVALTDNGAAGGMEGTDVGDAAIVLPVGTISVYMDG